jgi:SAM-dependent methyltransferase
MSQTDNLPTPFDDGALYDLLFTDFDYGLDFYLSLAKEANGRVLDVACGTGRILIPCLQAGLQADGLDLFAPMLTRCRDKANALGFNPDLYLSDMASFQLDRKYAFILIAFNAFVHLLTAEDQIGCLRSCREHLQPGGLLSFDTFFPSSSYVTGIENERVLEGELSHPEPGLRVRMYDTRSFDRLNQIQRSFNEMEILDSDGKVKEVHPSYTSIRWIYKNEMELLLRCAGFERWEILGGFNGRPLKDEKEIMVVKAWAS